MTQHWAVNHTLVWTLRILFWLSPYLTITPDTGRGFWLTEADHTVSLGSSEPFMQAVI